MRAHLGEGSLGEDDEQTRLAASTISHDDQFTPDLGHGLIRFKVAEVSLSGARESSGRAESGDGDEVRGGLMTPRFQFSNDER